MRSSAMLIFAAPFAMALLAPLNAGDTPRPSPPFTFQRKGAPAIDLKQYRGKVVALAFIHTTCPHCQQLTMSLSGFAKEFAGKDVQLLVCAFNDDAEATMPQFLSAYNPPFPVGWSYRGPVLRYLNISSLDATFMVPHMVFLDRSGIIQKDVRAQDEFFRNPDANIRAEINQLLAGRSVGAGKK
jgi:cytochrome oxidase Cu insertion factor (SCO1/SenC/PrrC family)